MELNPAKKHNFCHQRQVWMKLQLDLHLLLLTILQLHHLPPPLLPLVNNFCPVHPMPAPVCQLLYCTKYFLRYCTVRLKMFSLFCVCFLMYYLCENNYKPITIQYVIANCVNWVPRLTLLDLQTNWTYKCALWTELIPRGCTVLSVGLYVTLKALKSNLLPPWCRFLASVYSLI